MNLMSHTRLLDKMIDGYVSWRESCALVTDAYEAWASRAWQRDTLAFERYMAALDHEEQAAERYAKLVRRVERRLSGNDLRFGRLDTPVWEVP
jgi:hypothetical protein